MKSFWIKLDGDSMSPLIEHGDEIFIQNVVAGEVLAGDIVYFKDQATGELTLHRLIELPMVTKGDYSILSESNSSNVLIGKATKVKSGKLICVLPSANSIWMKAFLRLSLLRKNKIVSKLSRAIMIAMSYIFWRYNGKPTTGHSEKQLSCDL